LSEGLTEFRETFAEQSIYICYFGPFSFLKYLSRSLVWTFGLAVTDHPDQDSLLWRGVDA
jgi:hypothetical protein